MNKDLLSLEAEWVDFLESVPLQDDDINYTAYRLKQRSAFEQVCTHEMAALRVTAWQAYYRKDFVTAVETFETMLSDEPDNLSTLRGLMYSAYRMQDYDKALSLVNRIASTEDPRFSPEAILLKGDIHWLKNEHEKAVATYASIKTEYGTIEQRRIKRIAALSYPSVVHIQSNGTIREDRSLRELLRRVLIESKDAAEKMAYLSTCIQAAPDMWLAYLLAGELLHREKAWRSSNQYYDRAVTLLEKLEVSAEASPLMPLTSQQYRNLTLETRRSIGINAYHDKDYETAISIFSTIAKNETLPLGTTLKAEEWKQRCQWMQLHRQDFVNRLP